METWLDPFLAFSWSLTRWVHPSAAQRALSRIDFACTVCDACSTARVRASSGEYYSIVLSVMVDLDASLMFNTCENAPPVLERRLGRPEATGLDKNRARCVPDRISKRASVSRSTVTVRACVDGLVFTRLKEHI